MALVDYSESEGSDQEEVPADQEALKSKTNLNKSAFQKFVDRSNPHKIKISLPETGKATEDDVDETDRPAKRARVGGGGLSDFNAFLPAPKRATVSASGPVAIGGKRGGLGSGVNLRTGAAPGFSREPGPEIVTAQVEDEAMNGIGAGIVTEDGIHEKGLEETHSDGNAQSLGNPVEQPKPKGKTTMFKPLSVARKPQKKKPLPSNSFGDIRARDNESSQQSKLDSKKLSLFSVADTAEFTTTNQMGTKSNYQPMIYQVNEPKVIKSATESLHEEMLADEQSDTPIITQNADQAPQSLDTIATDLNLSASAKRQLLGRQKNNLSAINIVNFNTDEEYKQNELMRQAGEVVQHNAVRAIAPGKHSLKQLVNAASTQKDALEESFASGRRNKKEAGSKYGW